jgi:hypothetical protein
LNTSADIIKDTSIHMSTPKPIEHKQSIGTMSINVALERVDGRKRYILTFFFEHHLTCKTYSRVIRRARKCYQSTQDWNIGQELSQSILETRRHYAFPIQVAYSQPHSPIQTIHTIKKYESIYQWMRDDWARWRLGDVDLLVSRRLADASATHLRLLLGVRSFFATNASH